MIRITLEEGRHVIPRDQSCALSAVRGLFYATVHLTRPYVGEPIYDTSSEARYTLLDRITLADAPRRYR